MNISWHQGVNSRVTANINWLEYGREVSGINGALTVKREKWSNERWIYFIRPDDDGDDNDTNDDNDG